MVGWPPVRSYRKNILQQNKKEADVTGMYVKVSMDGAPFLRKIDLKLYNNYPQLLEALRNMFKCTIGNQPKQTLINLLHDYVCFFSFAQVPFRPADLKFWFFATYSN